MNDQQLFDNFFNACVVYAEDNGSPVTEPDNLCVLVDNGDQKITIQQWNHDSKQPTNDQLKTYTVAQINDRIKIKIYTKLLTIRKLTLITTADRNLITPTLGMQIFNITTGQIQVYVNGAWKNISYSLL